MTYLLTQIESILEHSDDLYMIIDREWKITYTNKLTERLLGVSDKEIIGFDLRDKLPDIVSMFYKTLVMTKNNQQECRFSARYGPTQKILELHSIPTEYGILAIFRDITVSEEQLLTIRDSEIRHRATLQTLTDALITIDFNGLISSINNAAEKLFGYESKEIIGKNVSFLLPEKDRPMHEEYTKFSDLNETRIINQFRELYAQRKDGSVFPIELNVSPMNMTGQYGYIGIIRDITRRKIAEDKIITERDNAERANQVKSDFLANMTHELRTPLHGILSYAELGISRINSANLKKLKKYFSNIDTCGTRLLGLVNDLLDLARLESGNVNLKIEPHVVKELILESYTELAAKIDENNLKFIIEPLESDISINCDEKRIKQVIINLLSNAIKFSPKGGEIIIRYSVKNDTQLEVQVIDQGIGIELSNLSRIFDKFIQDDSVRPGTGMGSTGLGLAICKEIIEAHKGTIIAKAKENLDSGANIVFTIPC